MIVKTSGWMTALKKIITGIFEPASFQKPILAPLAIALLSVLAMSFSGFPSGNESKQSIAADKAVVSTIIDANQKVAPQSSSLRAVDTSRVPPSTVVVGPQVSTSNGPLNVIERQSPTYIIRGPAQITGSLPVRTGDKMPNAMELLSQHKAGLAE